MKVAYLINQYPGTSHSFVRREIQALERLGVTVARYAIRASKAGLISEEDKAEAKKTRTIVGAPAGGLIAAMLSSLVRRPFGVASAFAAMVRLGWRGEPGLVRHGLYFLEALVLAAWMRRDQLTHVHAHFGTNSASVALMAARINGGTFSVTVHGPEEFDKPGLIGLKQKIEESAFVVGVSSYGMTQLRRLVSSVHWDKIKIVHCGIEDAFHAGEPAPLQAARTFVCVGRLSEQKGHITLIEAAAILAGARDDFKVTLVGDGELRAEIEDAARARGVYERFDFVGWRTPDGVRATIEEARVFVLPSYAEGLPVSIMEAFMLNRPVISTYVAGIPELVEPGVNGWLAPAGDAAALADVMGEALDADDATILAMAARGKEKTAAGFTIDREAAKLKSHFAQSLAAASLDKGADKGADTGS